jgi:hypothetical protein
MRPAAGYKYDLSELKRSKLHCHQLKIFFLLIFNVINSGYWAPLMDPILRTRSTVPSE